MAIKKAGAVAAKGAAKPEPKAATWYKATVKMGHAESGLRNGAEVAVRRDPSDADLWQAVDGKGRGVALYAEEAARHLRTARDAASKPVPFACQFTADASWEVAEMVAAASADIGGLTAAEAAARLAEREEDHRQGIDYISEMADEGPMAPHGEDYQRREFRTRQQLRALELEMGRLRDRLEEAQAEEYGPGEDGYEGPTAEDMADRAVLQATYYGGY